MARAFFLERRSPISSAEASGRPKSSAPAGGHDAATRLLLLVGLGPGLERTRGRVAEVLALGSVDAHAPIARLLAAQAGGLGGLRGLFGDGGRALVALVTGHGHPRTATAVRSHAIPARSRRAVISFLIEGYGRAQDQWVECARPAFGSKVCAVSSADRVRGRWRADRQGRMARGRVRPSGPSELRASSVRRPVCFIALVRSRRSPRHAQAAMAVLAAVGHVGDDRVGPAHQRVLELAAVWL